MRKSNNQTTIEKIMIFFQFLFIFNDKKVDKLTYNYIISEFVYFGGGKRKRRKAFIV